MKKILFVFILIFSLSFFCGCKQDNEVSIDENFILLSVEECVGGKVRQSITFDANSQQINKLASSLKEELDFRRNLIKQVQEIRNEFLFGFALTFIANPVDEYKINQGVVLSEVVYSEDSDCIGFEIYFTSLEAWNYYHKKAASEETTKSKPKENIFYKKSTSSGIFPFSSQIKVKDEQMLVGNVYKDRYLAAAKGLSFEDKLKEIYKPCYVYNYSTKLSKLRSDANFAYRGADKYYHHIWAVEDEKLSENNKISLSITIVYYGWWLFFAIVIPLAVCFVACLIVFLKQKRKRIKKS